MEAVIPEEPTHVADVREMLAYYHDIADDPGEISLLGATDRLPRSLLADCASLGVSWLTHTPIDPTETPGENIDRLHRGPPTV